MYSFYSVSFCLRKLRTLRLAHMVRFSPRLRRVCACALTSLPAPGRNAAFLGAFRRIWRSQIFCVQASRFALRLESNNQRTAVFTSCKERLNFLYCFRHCRTVVFATDLATKVIKIIIIFICTDCDTYSAACKARQTG